MDGSDFSDMLSALNRPRLLPIEEALGLGPAGLRQQAEIRHDLGASMLGWLHPMKLQDEIDRIEDELRRREEEPEHLEVPPTPGTITQRAAEDLLAIVAIAATGHAQVPDVLALPRPDEPAPPPPPEDVSQPGTEPV